MSTPGPAPAPAPAPTENLITPIRLNYPTHTAAQTSEFPNDRSGPKVFAASEGALQVTYMAGDYVLTSGTSTVRFAAPNIVRSGSDETIFEVVEGNTVHTLATTHVGVPRFSRRTYQYVNAGHWTRSVQDANGLTNTSSAFVFGVETPSGSLPRSGSAGYNAEVYGTMALAGEPDQLSMIGSGAVIADFATGSVSIQAGIQMRRPTFFAIYSPTTYNALLNGGGAIVSGQNMFAGTLSMSGIADLTGSFSGRFFGANLQEVGLAFHAQGSNASAAGTLTGLRDASVTKATLDTLGEATPMSGILAALPFGAGAPGEAARGLTVRAFVQAIEYSPASDTYTFTTTPGFFDYFGDGALTAGPSQRAAAQDRPGFVVYNVNPQTRAAIFEGAVGGVNLTYSSFARIDSVRSTLANGVGSYIAFLPFGLRTLPGGVPVSGRASYAGQIYGIANRTGYGTDYVERLAYTLSGSSEFEIDFSTHRVLGSLSPIGTSLDGSETRDFGLFTVDGSIGTLQHLVEARINDFPGPSLQGMFFGPRAEEFAASFSATTPDQLYALHGVALTVRR